MEAAFHRFSELFQQLGLPSQPEDIHAFLKRHAPLPDHLALADAPFWTAAQAALIKESLHADADWSAVIDQLNLALRRA